MKKQNTSEAMRRYWASRTPDERRKQTAGISGENRGKKPTGPTRLRADSERMREAIDLAVSILQSTDDPRLRCAVAVQVLLTVHTARATAPRKRPDNLIRVRLDSGVSVYADAVEVWRSGLTGCAVASRDDSGAPIRDSADSLPAWFVASAVVNVENLI